ncbi:MAG TPA: hypothetical protein VNK82_10190 [Terriglobales bacterium]|nr:hypothetical protein [Terriglobales bacterium]
MARSTLAKAGRGLLKSLLVLVCLAGTAEAQRGAITIPRNLNELTKRADLIVRGTVVHARVERHPDQPQMQTLVVTLAVKKTLKGQAQQFHTFRQYIWDIRDKLDAAGYRKGDEVLLMLFGPNRYGLSGLAGMEQGRFRIYRDRSGQEVAVNGAGNFMLFRGMQEQLRAKLPELTLPTQKMLEEGRAAPMAAADLEALIEQSVHGRR